MRLIIFFIFLISIISCKNSFDKEIEEHLQGDWSKEFYDKTNNDPNELPSIFFNINNIYKFSSDTIYDSNHFSIYNEKTNDFEYLGYKANFKIKNSVVYWYNTASKKDIEFGKVEKLSKDTIFFEHFMLVRNKVKQQFNNAFDAIIVTSSGCYGSCPIYNYRLESNGDIIYAGEKFTQIKGVYAGQINKEYFNYFKNKLNQINLNQTDNQYTNNATDGNFEEIVFIKNNQVTKRISFYMNDGPPKVKQLLDILRAMHYYIEDKKTYHYKDYFSIINPFTNTKEVNLEEFSDYQSFYLWTELMKHPSKPFQFKQKTFKINKFISKFWDSEYEEISPKSLETIETDGQQFQIKFKDSPIQYYDLGYNFLENNDLTYK
ncbi:hypothetical protein HX096_10175 [Empedobacter falsenii]|uniref:DUF6438 domain-containing protein n=1 Tax=Empedobacter falsenii TaxID=343874 RepID=UPI0025790895|nr:DUF6438 domain-containing protein [Empedobacter falsenii]MDM1548218.1 hypothetical protein [Empedobacter falsenii]